MAAMARATAPAPTKVLASTWAAAPVYLAGATVVALLLYDHTPAAGAELVAGAAVVTGAEAVAQLEADEL